MVPVTDQRMGDRFGWLGVRTYDSDVYGFRTSLTVCHRDIVDGQPMPVTVSWWSIQRFLNLIPMLRHVSRSRSVCVLSLKSTTVLPLESSRTLRRHAADGHGVA